LRVAAARGTMRLPAFACRVAGLTAAIALVARPALAHGFGQRYDLPLPLGLWIAGAAAAVALSFILVALFMRWTPGGARYPRFDLLRSRVGRALVGRPARFALWPLSVALLALVVAAGLVGEQTPTRNLAPTAIWIVWWGGFAYLSALVGNVWTVLNPWAALFGWYEALARRYRHQLPAPLDIPWPPWLGLWPAIALFAGFAWVELVFEGRAIPLELALLTLAYSVITWGGMFLFGRTPWLRRGDPFAVAFGVFARFAPTEIRVRNPRVCPRPRRDCGEGNDNALNCLDCFDRALPHEREWNLRPFGVGLLRTGDVTPSMVVFVLLMLSTVTFDGFTATPAWAGIENALYRALPALGGARLVLIGTLGLALFPIAMVMIYRLFAWSMAIAGGGELTAATTARLFVLSLVPIAIAYHLAHYFTYLLIQGQLIVRLASDPFGFGWDLLGTAHFRPDIALVGARFTWYVAVIAIVLGHVIAVCVAHMIALREYSSRRAALKSQLPMLVLMVGYTMASLWIVAQPIVETRPGASLAPGGLATAASMPATAASGRAEIAS
jgi:hypothetical protein